MARSKRYFGYGSNLNAADWRSSCDRLGLSAANLTPRGIARLPDHELAFAYDSAGRRGGVLDVRTRPGQLVEGVVFEANDDAWEALKRKEGVRRGIYEEFEAVVIDERGELIDVTTYRVTERHRRPYVRPNPAYLTVVRDGLRAHALSADQLLAAAADERPAFHVDAFFLYGTLMRGECRFPALARFDVRCALLARAFGRLVDLGSFPGLVDAAGGTGEMVEGEFVRVADVEGATRALDAIEGFRGFGVAGSLYRRKLIEVDVGDGRVRRAWTYVYAGDEDSMAAAARPIPSGDWRRHTGRRDSFLAALAAAHAGGADERVAAAVSQTYPHAMDADRVAATASLLPLADALCRGEVSERRLAQASGRWAVVP